MGRAAAYAARARVRLFGDVAIYVAPGSADHRAHPDLFRPAWSAGAPPDAFSDDGQLWGNPLYDWPAMRRHGYRWWIERVRRIQAHFDLVRIDHFRGFVAYWAVPAGARTRGAGAGGAAPAGPCSMRWSVSSGRSRWWRRTSGSITPAVRRCASRSGFRGWSCSSSGSTLMPPGACIGSRTTSRIGSCTRGRTTTTRRGGGIPGCLFGERSFVDASFDRFGVVEREPWWSLIGWRCGHRRGSRCSRRRTSSGWGSSARMNNPGRTGGELEVADGARGVDAGAGAAVAGGDRGGGAARRLGAAGWSSAAGRVRGGWLVSAAGRSASSPDNFSLALPPVASVPLSVPEPGESAFAPGAGASGKLPALDSGVSRRSSDVSWPGDRTVASGDGVGRRVPGALPFRSPFKLPAQPPIPVEDEY